jgi:hypothetical protein
MGGDSRQKDYHYYFSTLTLVPGSSGDWMLGAFLRTVGLKHTMTRDEGALLTG